MQKSAALQRLSYPGISGNIPQITRSDDPGSGSRHGNAAGLPELTGGRSRLDRDTGERACLADGVSQRGIRIIRKEDPDHIIEIDTGDEIEEIARQVNKMVRSIQELSQRNIALAEVNNRMEMQNLQAQINPHFIYNTLDNIRYLIPTDPQRAQQLIGRFIGILRYSINNTKHNVTVKDDLKYLQDYLVIQSTRFGANFSYEIDIDDACMEFIIPKLLLQPLLENSIKYGFQKKPCIHIRVRGWLGEDALYFTVEDNGGGVDETMLEQLRDILRSDEVNIEHNGLQNINRRIWLGYGGDSGLTIDSTESEGFTVKLKLRLGGM